MKRLDTRWLVAAMAITILAALSLSATAQNIPSRLRGQGGPHADFKGKSDHARIPDGIVQNIPTGPGGMEGYALGNTIPNFTSFDQYGIQRSLRDYAGKYVILDFCALWCGPCASMSTHAAGVRSALKAAGLPFEYISIMLTGANGFIGSSTRADAETWAFQARENSPVLSNPYQLGVPSTYGLWQAYTGITHAINDPNFPEGAIPTWVVLGPDQRILWMQIGAVDGQYLLDLFTYLQISPPLAAPPPVSLSLLDSVKLSVTAGATTLNADLSLDGSLNDLGGLGLFAAGNTYPGAFSAGPDGNAYLFALIDILTLHPFTGAPDFLPMDVPITVQVGDWKTLRYGSPARYVGMSYWRQGDGWLDLYGPGFNLIAVNDPLYAAGTSVTDFAPVSNTDVDQGTATFGGFSSARWAGDYGGLPWGFEISLAIRMLPPGVRMESMIAEINGAPLLPGVQQALTTRLSKAIPAMSPDADGKSACDWLDDFTEKVEAYSSREQIPPALAARLLKEASRTKDLLGCR